MFLLLVPHTRDNRCLKLFFDLRIFFSLSNTLKLTNVPILDVLRILNLVDHLDLFDRIAFLLSDATVSSWLHLARPLQFGLRILLRVR